MIENNISRMQGPSAALDYSLSLQAFNPGAADTFVTVIDISAPGCVIELPLFDLGINSQTASETTTIEFTSGGLDPWEIAWSRDNSDDQLAFGEYYLWGSGTIHEVTGRRCLRGNNSLRVRVKRDEWASAADDFDAIWRAVAYRL